MLPAWQQGDEARGQNFPRTAHAVRRCDGLERPGSPGGRGRRRGPRVTVTSGSASATAPRTGTPGTAARSCWRISGSGSTRDDPCPGRSKGPGQLARAGSQVNHGRSGCDVKDIEKVVHGGGRVAGPAVLETCGRGAEAAGDRMNRAPPGRRCTGGHDLTGLHLGPGPVREEQEPLGTVSGAPRVRRAPSPPPIIPRGAVRGHRSADHEAEGVIRSSTHLEIPGRSRRSLICSMVNHPVAAVSLTGSAIKRR